MIVCRRVRVHTLGGGLWGERHQELGGGGGEGVQACVQQSSLLG